MVRGLGLWRGLTKNVEVANSLQMTEVKGCHIYLGYLLVNKLIVHVTSLANLIVGGLSRLVDLNVLSFPHGFKSVLMA
jgi:hypothetical protein